LQGTEQSFESLAEGPEAGFARRLAHVEQDLNQKLGKLVEVTTALSVMWDERFAGLESRLRANGESGPPPTASVASVDTPNPSQLSGKLVDLQTAFPVQDFKAETTELRERLAEQRTEFEHAFQGLQSDLLLLNFRMEELRGAHALQVTTEVSEAACASHHGDGRAVFPEHVRSGATPPPSQLSSLNDRLARVGSGRIRDGRTWGAKTGVPESPRPSHAYPTATPCA
jgi:hypothetical protein